METGKKIKIGLFAAFGLFVLFAMFGSKFRRLYT